MPTCPDQPLTNVTETPLWTVADTNIGLTFHELGELIAALFAGIAIFISCFLIFGHATHYSRPGEQRHIIRILFMIPMYATVSLLSFHFYRNHIYYEVIRDCYEAFAISSFFHLLCHYIAPTLHEQKEYFRGIEVKNWWWPITWVQKCTGGMEKGLFRRPSSGLTWFNVGTSLFFGSTSRAKEVDLADPLSLTANSSRQIIWTAIFQYCFIRVFFTIVSVITQATDTLCEGSHSPAFAEIYVETFEAVAVSIAMYCLIQFYVQLKQDLAPHKPFLKVLCIKLVIFFCFWQTFVINWLTGNNTIKSSAKVAYADIKVGIPAMLICVEMAVFSVMHVFAFSWKEYVTTKEPTYGAGAGFGAADGYKGGPMGIKALIDAFNPWDIVKAFARGMRWLFVGVRRRHTDSSYHKAAPSSTLDPAATGIPVEMTNQTPYTGAQSRRRSSAGTLPGHGGIGMPEETAYMGRMEPKYDPRFDQSADGGGYGGYGTREPRYDPRFDSPPEGRSWVGQETPPDGRSAYMGTETAYHGAGHRAPYVEEESDEIHLLSQRAVQPRTSV